MMPRIEDRLSIKTTLMQLSWRKQQAHPHRVAAARNRKLGMPQLRPGVLLPRALQRLLLRLTLARLLWLRLALSP